MQSAEPQVAILGIPFRGGQPKAGVDLAPEALRRAGINKIIEDLGYGVKDLGDVSIAFDESKESPPTNPEIKAKNSHWVGSNMAQVTSRLSEQLSKAPDTFLLNLGGDHSIAIGTLSALLDAHQSAEGEDGGNLCLVWVDAHADINTPKISQSGNIHGMPVAFVARHADLVEPWTLEGFEWMQPKGKTNRRLNLSKLVYIGLRDVEPAEEEILKKYSIRSYYMKDVNAKGIDTIMKETITYLGLDQPHTTNKLHLSFDIDAMDPSFCPATGTAVPDGLTMSDGLAICEACGKTGRLVGMDLVEVNTELSDKVGADSTVSTGIALIKAALASRHPPRH